jgi:hypothetical protein
MREEAEVRDGEESCKADVRNDEVAILVILYSGAARHHRDSRESASSRYISSRYIEGLFNCCFQF